MKKDEQLGTGLYRPDSGSVDKQVATGIYRTDSGDSTSASALGLDDPNSPLSLALASITLNAVKTGDGILIDDTNNIAIDVENLPALP